MVTGSPGVGKSAVLGRIVTTADADLRRLLPPDDEAVRAAVGSVACAVHAKGKTALEVAAELARAVSAELPSDLDDAVPFLRTALEQGSARRFNVVLDALDEAQSPEQARLMAERLALPLVETCADVGAQVVVGTRRYDAAGEFVGSFGPAATTIDLDLPAYFAFDDLAAYALASLQLAGDERDANPYTRPEVAEPLARRIAELADGNFLVAGLLARDHGLHDEVAVSPLELAPTSSVETALGRFVDRLPQRGALHPELALSALAFAEAPGFDANLWALVIGALSGEAVGHEELASFARSSAANFLVEAADGSAGPTFRLFHQALNDALLARRATTGSLAADEAVIARVLMASGRELGWTQAPAYVLRSLPGHAARAGLVEDLLDDGEYLLYADLTRLLLAAHGTATPGQRLRLLTLTPEAVRADPPTRASLLSVTNALESVGAHLPTIAHQLYCAGWARASRRTELSSLEGHTGGVSAVCALEVGGRALLASGSKRRHRAAVGPRQRPGRVQLGGPHRRGQRRVRPGGRRPGPAGLRER